MQCMMWSVKVEVGESMMWCVEREVVESVGVCWEYGCSV